MEFSLAQVRRAIDAKTLGQPDYARSTMGRFSRAHVSGWSIDSRTTRRGDLFFAITGERHDGHEFAGPALDQGAVAAVLSRRINGVHGIVLEVPDTLRALQNLAHWARHRWGGRIIAITGSAGKTTTKDVIAALLSHRFRVGKTEGNLNNHIGVPLSILRLPDAAEVGVIEMGMNHAGEIRELAAIAEPDIAVITNVGFAHIEAFDSIDGVAAAKRELIESLSAAGIAVLNADDERVAAFRAVHAGRVLTYGLSHGSDIRATELKINPSGTAFSVCGVRFHTRLTGRHNVLNVLAGLAVATIFEIDFRELVDAVAGLAPGDMRGQRIEWHGIAILNDSYNSNPEASRAMVDLLGKEPAQRRIAVLGEMLELGRLAETLHRDLGRYVANAGIDVLVGVRGVSRFMVEEGKKAGLGDHAAVFFDEPEAAGLFLRDFVRPGDAILFKGSRGTHIEKAIATMEA